MFVDFSKAFDRLNGGNMEQIPQAYGFPKETAAAIMMLNKNTKAMVGSPDSATYFFDIVVGDFQGNNCF